MGWGTCRAPEVRQAETTTAVSATIASMAASRWRRAAAFRAVRATSDHRLSVVLESAMVDIESVSDGPNLLTATCPSLVG
ncbi:hypothetical protein GCM10023081_42520 [Arthrobacter ginkgonis]|uniref:Uncharacterized protein n=1 Tax=Arthrobacter ginkgonis TaxID=1630594 RepID=A0ABP7D9M6_9MICC